MSDDFEKININILEPRDSDSKSTKDLWIVAPASSREEALILMNELQY